MATQKPISTISYNTLGFLKDRLEQLYNAHIIQAYMYICHKGEEGDRDHIHLRIEPNKRLDAMDLFDEFIEYDGIHDKPLCCRPFRLSVEEDWFLYVVHDPEYLKLKYGGGDKGEKIPYSFTEIQASPFYDVATAFIRAKASMNHSSVNLAMRIKEGESPLTLILEGENVHIVNAIVNAVSHNEVPKLKDELNNLKNYIYYLHTALSEIGMFPEIDDLGQIHL